MGNIIFKEESADIKALRAIKPLAFRLMILAGMQILNLLRCL